MIITTSWKHAPAGRAQTIACSNTPSRRRKHRARAYARDSCAENYLRSTKPLKGIEIEYRTGARDSADGTKLPVARDNADGNDGGEATA